MDSYNVNRKVVTFGDFTNNIESEKEELKKVRRSTNPNSDEHQQHIGNGRYKFNKVTRKMDDLSPKEVQDKLDAIEDLEETNESIVKYIKLFENFNNLESFNESKESLEIINNIKSLTRRLEDVRTQSKEIYKRTRSIEKQFEEFRYFNQLASFLQNLEGIIKKDGVKVYFEYSQILDHIRFLGRLVNDIKNQRDLSLANEIQIKIYKISDQIIIDTKNQISKIESQYKKYSDTAKSELTNELFNFNKERKGGDSNVINTLRSEINSAFRPVAVVDFNSDRNNSREPSIDEVIKNIEDIISKYK